MRKFLKTIVYILDRNGVWAYQEILIEALVVLWFALQTSLTFGTRFFPQWQNTRVDPSTPTDLGVLLTLLGFEKSGCLFNFLVPTGKLSDNMTHSVGYIAIFVTVCTTIALCVSVICSMFINRNWRYPQWKQHIRGCQHFQGVFARIAPPASALGICLVCVYAITGCISLFACVFVWLLLWTLPFVLVSGALFGLIINWLDLEVVFPCCVLFVCILGVYCTGRIWGLWVNETYFGWINKTFRESCGVTLVVDSGAVERVPLAAAEIETAPPTTKKKMDAVKIRLCFLPLKIVILVVWLIAVIVHMEPLKNVIRSGDVLRQQWEWRRRISSRDLSYFGYCSVYGTDMKYPEAMMSYWVDLGYPRWNTTHPGLLPLFTSTYSPVTDAFLQGCFWSIPLFNGIPAAILSFIVVMAFLSHHRSRGGHNQNSTAITHSEIQAEQDGEPQKGMSEVISGTTELDATCAVADTNVPVENTLSDPEKTYHCFCPWGAGIVAYGGLLVRRCFLYFFLPYPLVQLFVPEWLQLWALLLLLTAYGGWTTWKCTQDVLQVRREAQMLVPSTDSPTWLLNMVS